MYHRKIVDEIKIRKLWWLEPWQRPRMRKNRKQCSCWMCRNPRQDNSEVSIPPTELSKRRLMADEIEEYIISQQK